METLVTSKQDIRSIFEQQKAYQFEVANTTASQRIAKLTKLHKSILKHKDAIREALYQDFGKPVAEVDLSEIYILTHEIKHVKRNLYRWMSKKRVKTPLALMGSSSWIHYEPKGTCLVIAPWNFPVNLTLGPMISAVAAGNTVILKPSESTPHAAAVMRTIVEEVFDPREVALVEGAVETSTELLALPFNHIFFTGAPSIGKVVMEAAAKNLSSVTLELGGKSPTIIDETANLKTAANRIAWGKYLNAGQICIAPDYVLVHESKQDAFIKEVGNSIKRLFGEDASKSGDYAQIVNKRHFNRVKSYIDDAVSKGARVAVGGKLDESTNTINPMVVKDLPLDSDLLNKEIFGPVLPVVPYKSIDEAIQFVNAKEKPLALYIYSSKPKNVSYIMANTRAGGTCINNNDVHFFNNNLPFGGSNNSGIGKSHGYFGFEAFSNARGVYKQHIPGALEMLMPPYNNLKQKIIDLTIKWF